MLGHNITAVTVKFKIRDIKWQVLLKALYLNKYIIGIFRCISLFIS